MKVNQQSGQALIASMVMIAFVFALAGGLAVAASSLLTQQNTSRSVLTDELLAQNEVNSAVAWAAGRGLVANQPYCQSPTMLPALGPSGEILGIQCVEVDNVSSSSPGVVPLSWNGGSCSVTPFPASAGRTFIWVNGASALSAFVDQGAASGCVSGAGTVCSTTGSAAPSQVVLDCNLTSVGSPVLHVSASGRTPLAARYSRYAGPYIETPWSPLPARAAPADIAVADLTGTGRPDLVVANSGSDNVSVFPGGPGNGSFQARVDYPAGPSPTSLWVGDLNGDGRPDIVVGDSGSNQVSVLLNKGNGTFAANVTYPVDGPPAAVVAGNFDGHGRADLAVATSGTSQVEVLPNNGNGTFGSSIESPIPADASAIVAGDFNGNGKSDVAVVENGKVLILMGNDGDGTFDNASGGPYSVGAGQASIACADVDGDGVDDLVVTNRSTGQVTVLLGTGVNGRFGQAPGSPFTVGSGVSSVTIADFNSDNISDLAVVDAVSNTVSVWNGRGDGTFWQDAGGPIQVGIGPAGVAAGDFNRDGTLDLATANAGSSNVTVLLANHARSSVYSFAAPIPGGFEEADLWVSGDGAANQLTYEGKL